MAEKKLHVEVSFENKIRAILAAGWDIVSLKAYDGTRQYVVVFPGPTSDESRSYYGTKLDDLVNAAFASELERNNWSNE